MIWLTWRQFRVQAVTAAAALAAFAILLAVTGPHLASRYAASTITGCHDGTCMTAAITFLSGKAIDLGGSTSLFSGGRFSSLIFATHGITPLGYAALAFALGTAIGALIRRTVPAMAITLAIFAAAQVAMPLGVRPHLIPPDRMIATIDSVGLDFGNLTATVVPGQPGAWMLSSGAINAAGLPVSNLPAACQAAFSGLKPSSPGPCMESRGIREAITYEPASRYWPLQWIETGIFGALALALAGFCLWRLGRRLT